MKDNCYLCKNIGYYYEREHSIIDDIAGNPLAPIWVIGINPRTPKGQTEPYNDNCTSKEQLDFFKGKLIENDYMKRINKICPKLYQCFKDDKAANLDAVKCYSHNFSTKFKNKLIYNCSNHLHRQLLKYENTIKVIICNGIIAFDSIKLFSFKIQKINNNNYEYELFLNNNHKKTSLFKFSQQRYEKKNPIENIRSGMLKAIKPFI